MEDVQNFLKMLTADTIQTALDAEPESELDYSKYGYKNKSGTNSRNGYSQKTVQGSQGELEINIPCDRNGEFEPQLVKKHQTDISSIKDKVIFLYSEGVSTRDIQKTMRDRNIGQPRQVSSPFKFPLSIKCSIKRAPIRL